MRRRSIFIASGFHVGLVHVGLRQAIRLDRSRLRARSGAVRQYTAASSGVKVALSLKSAGRWSGVSVEPFHVPSSWIEPAPMLSEERASGQHSRDRSRHHGSARVQG